MYLLQSCGFYYVFFLRGNDRKSYLHQTEIAVLSGSTHVLTPRRLLDEVKSLNKPKDTVCIKDE